MNSTEAPYSGFWTELPRPFFVLAPMEDVTDFVFRSVMARAGSPDVWFSEFSSALGVSAARPDAIRRLMFDPARNRPMVAQIWGRNPEDFFHAAARIRGMGFSGIDINMGCPQRKITKGGSCAALIRTPLLAKEIVRAAIAGAQQGSSDSDGRPLPALPVSVKTRIGFKTVETEEWLSAILEERPAVLTVHARTAAQQSEGLADWTQVALAVRLRERISPGTLVVGNGDVETASVAMARHAETNCDGIMIGRGVFANPFIFRNARSVRDGHVSKAGGISFADLADEGRIAWARYHLRLYKGFWGSARNFEIMKKFFKIYLNGSPRLDAMRSRIMDSRTYGDCAAVLSESPAGDGKLSGSRGPLMLC